MARRNEIEDEEFSRIFGDMGFGSVDRDEIMADIVEQAPADAHANRRATASPVAANMRLEASPAPSLRRSMRVAKLLEKQAEIEEATAAARAAAEAEKKFAKTAKEERRADLKMLASRVAELHGHETPEDLRARLKNPLLEEDTKTAIKKLAHVKEAGLMKKKQMVDQFYEYLMEQAEAARRVGERTAEEILRARAQSLRTNMATGGQARKTLLAPKKRKQRKTRKL